MTTGGGALTGKSAARAAVGPRTRAATAPSMIFFLMIAPRNLSRLTLVCLPDRECRTTELVLQLVALRTSTGCRWRHRQERVLSSNAVEKPGRPRRRRRRDSRW